LTSAQGTPLTTLLVARSFPAAEVVVVVNCPLKRLQMIVQSLLKWRQMIVQRSAALSAGSRMVCQPTAAIFHRVRLFRAGSQQLHPSKSHR